MEFGRAENIESLARRFDSELKLPPTSPRTLTHWKTLQNSQGSKDFRFYLGLAVWGCPEWVGSLYPKGTKQAAFLGAYAKKLSTVEVNPTHYRMPTRELLQKWRVQVGDDFRFCPKVYQGISHHRQLDNYGSMVADFFGPLIEVFGEQLGPCFLQMPPHFDSERGLKRLEKFYQDVPMDLPVALELRHESWFVNHELISPLVDLLEHHNQPVCISDVSGRRDVLHTSLPSRTVLLRFVGHDLHESDFRRLDDWVERIIEWKNAGLEEFYFFAHSYTQHLALTHASYLSERLSARGLSLRSLNVGNEQLNLLK